MFGVDFEQILRQPGILAALKRLREAREMATALAYEHTTFSLELHTILSGGCSTTQLRALIMTGLVQHAVETTAPGSFTRRFHLANAKGFELRSCFTLTEYGEKFLSFVDLNGSSRCTKDEKSVTEPPAISNPHWSVTDRELWLDETLVKRFTRPAPCLELILSAFQEQDWPTHLDDPLPPIRDIDPKERLHDTIKRLNRCQKQKRIRFRGDGSGIGVRWEIVIVRQYQTQMSHT